MKDKLQRYGNKKIFYKIKFLFKNIIYFFSIAFLFGISLVINSNVNKVNKIKTQQSLIPNKPINA